MNSLEDYVEHALGCNTKDALIVEFISYLKETPQIEVDEDFGDCFYIFKKKGVTLLFNEENLLSTVYLYYVSQGDTDSFKGEYFGIRDCDSYEAIISKLGSPTYESSGGEESALEGGVSPFVVYDKSAQRLNIELSSDKSTVQLVTIMDKELVGDFD